MNWFDYMLKAGDAGLLLFIFWKVVPLALAALNRNSDVLDRNTRVMERIEGFLLGKGMTPEAPAPEEKEKVS